MVLFIELFLFIPFFIILILLASFLHQYYLMIFLWSLRDRKSPQVSCSLLSILADLNSAVVLLFPGRPVPVPFLWRLYWARQLHLVSPSLSWPIGWSWFVLRFPLFQSLFQARQLQLLLLSPMFDSFLSFSVKSKYCSLSFAFFLHYGLLTRKNPLYGNFSLLCQLSISLLFWLGLEDLLISQNPCEFTTSHSLWRILV